MSQTQPRIGGENDLTSILLSTATTTSSSPPTFSPGDQGLKAVSKDAMIEPDESATDGQLYLLAVEGNREATRLLVDRYDEDLLRYTLAKTRDLSMASDAAGETWLRFFEHLAQAADDETRRLRKPDSLRFWLYKTAFNSVRSEYRHQSRRRDLFTRVSDERDRTGGTIMVDDSTRLERVEAHTTVVAAFGRLGESCRELLALMVSDPPLSYQEISTITGRPVGSLGPTRQRCLDRLRKHMGVQL